MEIRSTIIRYHWSDVDCQLLTETSHLNPALSSFACGVFRTLLVHCFDWNFIRFEFYRHAHSVHVRIRCYFEYDISVFTQIEWQLTRQQVKMKENNVNLLIKLLEFICTLSFYHYFNRSPTSFLFFSYQISKRQQPSSVPSSLVVTSVNNVVMRI